MTQHKLIKTEKDKELGPMSSITPSCTCGWHGYPEYAYEDYQHTNVIAQFDKHLNLEKSND